MVKHIVMWSFKEDVPVEERAGDAVRIQEGLEGLVGVVPGLLSARVVTDLISSSTHDLSLICEFDNADSLKAYKDNPDHVKVASFVRSVTCNRACLDFED